MNKDKDKEASGQIKTIVEGIAERITKELIGQAVLDLLNSDGHVYSKRPCQTCRTISTLIEQPFGCVKKALQQPEHRANFLWDYPEDSVERAGYEFANGQTEPYRKLCWKLLKERIAVKQKDAKPPILNQCDYIDVADLPEDAASAYREFARKSGIHNGEHWSYMIGDDGTVESYIGEQQRLTIDNALIAKGLRGGSIIDLVFSW